MCLAMVNWPAFNYKWDASSISDEGTNLLHGLDLFLFANTQKFDPRAKTTKTDVIMSSLYN